MCCMTTGNCNRVIGAISAQPPAKSALGRTPVSIQGPNSVTLPHLVCGDGARTKPNPRLAFTLEGVLSGEECVALIAAAEGTGAFTAAGLGGSGKQQVDKRFRDSDRLISEDCPLARLVWERVSPYVPVCCRGRPVIGLNEQMKILKYAPGQSFAPHFDGSFVRPGTNNRTCITLQMYLSDDGNVHGGATNFVSPVPDPPDGSPQPECLRTVPCLPLRGRALLFEHAILHEGAAVDRGVKYTIRTDVEYGPQSWISQVREELGLGGSPLQLRQRLFTIGVVFTGFLFLLLGVAVGFGTLSKVGWFLV